MPSASTVAVPFAGPEVTAGGPVSPRSLAATSIETGVAGVVVAASSAATGNTVTRTVPASHRPSGSGPSQPRITNRSAPVNSPVGVYTNAPIGATVADPCDGPKVTTIETTPPSASSLVTAPETGEVAVVVTTASPTFGAWFAGSTVTVTDAWSQTLGVTSLQIS